MVETYTIVMNNNSRKSSSQILTNKFDGDVVCIPI